MGTCCSCGARNGPIDPADPNNGGSRPGGKTSSKVYPMPVLDAAQQDGIDPLLVQSLKMYILPFIKTNTTALYDQAFHAFVKEAKNCPVGQFHGKLPGILEQLLKQETEDSIAKAKKQRIARVGIQQYQESRPFTCRRIMTLFREMLCNPFKELVIENLLKEKASADKFVDEAIAETEESTSEKLEHQLHENIMDTVLDAVGTSLKQNQMRKEVELVSTTIMTVVKYIKKEYADQPPKELLRCLERHLIFCELISTERAYVATLKNLMIYRDRLAEMAKVHKNDVASVGRKRLKQKHVDQMFHEVKPLFDLNTIFLNDIEEALTTWDPRGSSSIGKLLNTFSQHFRM